MSPELPIAGIRLNLKQISIACDVAVGTVQNWVDQKDLPSESEGRQRTVALSDLLPFLARRYANESGEHRDRLAAAQADRVEFENDVRRGEFIPVAVHADLLVGVAGEVARQLAGMPGRVAGELAGINDAALVRARLIDECNDVRNAVAKHLDGIAESSDPALPDGGEDHGGAETDNAGPVGGRESRAPAGDGGAGEVAVQ